MRKLYFQLKDDLNIMKEVIFRGDRILIPNAMKQEVLMKLHSGHPGINRMIDRAKLSVFWLGMVQDIKNWVGCCRACLKYQNKKQKMNLMPKRYRNSNGLLPWMEVGCDTFEWNNRNFLVVVDTLSNYPEVVELTTECISNN